MRFRLRTLLTVVSVVPPMVAAVWLGSGEAIGFLDTVACELSYWLTGKGQGLGPTFLFLIRDWLWACLIVFLVIAWFFAAKRAALFKARNQILQRQLDAAKAAQASTDNRR